MKFSIKNLLFCLTIVTVILFAGIDYFNLQNIDDTPVGAYIGTTQDLQIDVSNATALNNGENWTTGWFDRNGYASLKVAFKTDQDGYFTIEYSPDGTNTDSTLTRYYRTAQIEPPHKFENMRRYVKVTFYNNSGSNQTYLRPDISLTNSAGLLNIPQDATMSQDYDAIAVRSSNYIHEVARGLRQGHSIWNKFGYNADVDTGTEEVVATWGGAFQYLTSGETLNISSTDATDDLASTGAQKIIIYGVDSNWNPQTEVIEMDGTTIVTTATSWIGISRMAVHTASTTKANAGIITATSSVSGYTLGQIPDGDGTSQQSIFYVPADHQALADWLLVNVRKLAGGTAPRVTIRAWVYSAVSNSEYEVFRYDLDTNIENHIDLEPPIPFQIGEKSIFWLTAETNTNDTIVGSRFSLVLSKNVDN